MANDFVTTEADNTPEKLFQAKIQERIRGDLGDLIPDSVLEKLVRDSIRSELYTDIKEYTHDKPLPWVREIVQTYTKNKVREYVTQALHEHDAEFFEVVKTHIEGQLPNIIASLIMATVKNSVSDIAYNLEQKLRADSY